MPDPRPGHILFQHFFRRFFQNDLLQSEGDTITTVVRALSILAAPGLLLSFFLQNSYPSRTPWGRVEDHYFFVLFSFVALAGVSVFEWDMLFPDRLDFLVLSPLPLGAARLFLSKSLALAAFLGTFLLGANLFGIVFLPMVTKSGFWHPLFAHALAVLLAGTFSSLGIAGLGGLLLCVLPEQLFRRVSPVFQMLTVTALGLLLVHCARTADSIEQLLSPSPGLLRFVPPFWFLGLYEQTLHGAQAPAFAAPMARLAWLGTLAAAALFLLTYPTAWARARRMAVESSTPRLHAARPGPVARIALRLLPQPPARAIFFFIGQTMTRNTRYQVYLALYAGAGLALSLSCGVSLYDTTGHLRLAIAPFGLHAVLPLLLFWVVAGLSTAFAFPLNLPAAWVFRTSGADLRTCLAAARSWALAGTLAVFLLLLLILRALGLGAVVLSVQAVCGLVLAVALVQGFFFAQNRVPFTQPRIPGRSSLPLLLTLYVGVLTPFIFGVMAVERAFEHHPLRLLWLLPVLPLLRTAAARLRSSTVTFEEEREGDGGELQLLGLAGDLTA